MSCFSFSHKCERADDECRFFFFAFFRFSVSKWIHLNGGDAGLRRFFERVYGALVPGGTFVFEAQPRDSYVKARKLHPVRAILPSYDAGFI